MELGKKLGISNVTASKYFREIDDGLGNKWGIKEFYNKEDNKYKRAIMILRDLLGREV